jgi:signal transduction histidine kinase
MKMSIRTRLFITVSLLIVFFVAFSWLMNTSYLEKYYVNQNKQQLILTTQQINAVYTGNVEDLSVELEKLERLSGLNILILDQNLAVKYYSLGAGNDMPPGPDRRRMRQPDLLIPLVSTYQTALQAEGQVVAISQDPNLQTGLLNVVSKLNNGDYLLLSKPLVSFQESAAVANRFFLFTGLLTILIGCGAVFIFSRRFTRPILKLNAIAQKMSELDFSEKYVAPHQDELGALGQSINSLSDQLDKSISELQAANQKLQAEIDHERSIDLMRKQFISNVSHELKTPIALIQGYAEGLKVNVIEDEEGKIFYCDVIADEAAKMNKMVLELLDLSQIEAGYFQLEKEVFDLPSLARQMVAKYEHIFKDGKIELIEDKHANLLVYADRARIEQVLTNYLDNALNHVDERREIRVKLEKLASKVRIAVFNSGLPIPEEAQDKIFTSFYKVDKARTRAYGGTGLGLSIVRAIMEMHNNHYGTDNLPDGVDFWFELDKAEPA